MTQPPDTNQLRQILVDLAKKRATIDYKTLTTLLAFNPPNSIAKTTALLEACQTDDALLQQPQIAALVIQKSGDPCPRPGFFQKLTELGVYQGSDRGIEASMWHQNELEKVFNYYSD